MNLVNTSHAVLGKLLLIASLLFAIYLQYGTGTGVSVRTERAAKKSNPVAVETVYVDR